MKKILTGVLILLFHLGCKTTMKEDSVKTANHKNEERANAGTATNEAALFLVKVADARMMGGLEGALAVERGTTPDIKNYGKRMVKDQKQLLSEIRKIATSMHIALPEKIGADKADGLKDLKEKQGKDFDDKFCRMMKIDHERDLDDFKEALELDTRMVKEFAAARLPMIQSHLDGINEIRKK